MPGICEVQITKCKLPSLAPPFISGSGGGWESTQIKTGNTGLLNHLLFPLATSRLPNPQLESGRIEVKVILSQPGSPLSVVVNTRACFRMALKSLIRAKRIPGLCKSSCHIAASPQPRRAR